MTLVCFAMWACCSGVKLPKRCLLASRYVVEVAQRQLHGVSGWVTKLKPQGNTLSVRETCMRGLTLHLQPYSCGCLIWGIIRLAKVDESGGCHCSSFIAQRSRKAPQQGIVQQVAQLMQILGGCDNHVRCDQREKTHACTMYTCTALRVSFSHRLLGYRNKWSDRLDVGSFALMLNAPCLYAAMSLHFRPYSIYKVVRGSCWAYWPSWVML